MVVNKKKSVRKQVNRLKPAIKPIIGKRKTIRKPREYIPGYEYGTGIESIEEPIDFEPLPERTIGIKTHRKPASYQDPGGIYVTVHKEKYKMAEQRGINKMGGLASINCSQHFTEACNERYNKAREHNAKIKEAEKLLDRLMRKQNPTDIETRKIGELQQYITQVRENVCGYCYAELGEKGLKGGAVRPRYKSQGDFLRSHILTREEIPQFNPGEVIRINSHGDIESGEKGVIQFINYLNMAYQNPHTYFTLWTKQGTIVNDAFRRIGFQKPRNMTFIWSNTWIDKPILRPPASYNYFDGVFNVVSFEYYNANKNTLFGIKTDPKSGSRVEVIKCERLCQSCRACYSGKTNFSIIEVVKDDARRHHEEIYAERKTKARKAARVRKVIKPRKINPQKYIPIPMIFRG